MNNFPNQHQLEALYRVVVNLTNLFRSIELVRLDERTGNIFVLAGEDIELIIPLDGVWKFDND